MDKIIKFGGHCYDSMGWDDCPFWGRSKGKSCCNLFGGAEKDASQSLVCCNKIYGEDYEGRV